MLQGKEIRIRIISETNSKRFPRISNSIYHIYTVDIDTDDGFEGTPCVTTIWPFELMELIGKALGKSIY